jgi:hypothetical protein
VSQQYVAVEIIPIDDDQTSTKVNAAMSCISIMVINIDNGTSMQ